MEEAIMECAILVVGGERVMTIAEWAAFLHLQQLKVVAELMQRPGIQNGLAKIEEMEAAGK